MGSNVIYIKYIPWREFDENSFRTLWDYETIYGKLRKCHATQWLIVLTYNSRGVTRSLHNKKQLKDKVN